jgi:hypothetical protein
VRLASLAQRHAARDAAVAADVAADLAAGAAAAAVDLPDRLTNPAGQPSQTCQTP